MTEVEVVITDADFDGTNLVYTIENTSITANQSFTDVSLFVDANEYYNAFYVEPNNIVMSSEGAVNNEQGNIGNEIYTVVDLTTLKFLIDQGDDVSHVVTSLVTDMSELFENNNSFNQDISTWDVSNVTDMSAMFSDATQFNQDIINWDVGNVRNMSEMFQGASSFNQLLKSWDVSNVTDMFWMFHVASSFNQPLENWDVSNVTSMNGMFANASTFNQDCSGWSVSNVTDCGRFNDDSPISQEFIPNFTNCSI